MSPRILLASAAMLPLLAAPALGEAQQRETMPAGDHVHEAQPQEIIVTAPFIRDLDLLAGTAVLAGTDLVRDIRPQLGDTLARLPGVSATSFSPGASRPVLRGFQGERVRVLTDGLGSIDVSNTSADHGVTIDPLTSDRIEVLHGPAALLFGSQAIGGAVNVFDRRIPRAVPDDPVHVDMVGALGSAADERSIGAGIDVPVAGGLVLHLDGSLRRTGDQRVGGHVLSPSLRAEQLEIYEEELAERHGEEAAEALAFANLRGRIPNSFTRQETAGAGLALIRSGGSLGMSVSYYGSRYGVPERPGGHHHGHDDHDHDHDDHDHDGDHGHHHEGPVTIDMKQVRADLRGEVETGGTVLERLRLRLGAADYEHTEFEGGEVGTVFRTKGMEGRLELVQAARGGWRGVTGVQYGSRDFSAVGAEAFVPPHGSGQFGLFTLQEVNFGRLELEGAARYERSHVRARQNGFDRGFDAVSGAVGLSFAPDGRSRFGLNLSRAERAPAPEELLSDGPHIATQAFEIGDPGLVTERALGAELFARHDGRGYALSASVYANRFDDFIYLDGTDEEEDGLPVFRYRQADAIHYGFELSGSATVARVGGVRIVAYGVADHVRARLRGGLGPVPRIPPLRLLGGIEAQSAHVDGRLEVERVFAQERIAAFETPTDGFTLVNASIVWRPWGREEATSLILSANNILDADARRHASFTKDFVPLAGRDIRLAARLSF